VDAAEELANMAQQLRYQRDKGRLCARLLLQSIRNAGNTPPAWIAKEVDAMPDPTTEPSPAPGEPTTIAAPCGQVNALRAENAELVDMLLDATNQAAGRHPKDPTRLVDHALSTWERILPELVTRGLAEGNEKDGYRLIWPEPTP
jgi:hypothetical protein